MGIPRIDTSIELCKENSLTFSGWYSLAVGHSTACDNAYCPANLVVENYYLHFRLIAFVHNPLGMFYFVWPMFGNPPSTVIIASRR